MSKSNFRMERESGDAAWSHAGGPQHARAASARRLPMASERRTIRDVSFHRRTLHRTDALLVEDSALPSARPLGRDYSAATQFAFPYFGAFRWRVGAFDRLIDSNAILKVNGGEEFFESHPVPGTGHASVILTPSPALLDELQALAKRAKSGEVPTASPMSERIRLMVHDLAFNGASALKLDEIAIDLMVEASGAEAGGVRRTSKLVERAKEMLNQRFMEPVSLDWIAGRLGVTPVYLTQIFRRQEGVPLYRYQTRLRLNRALLLLRRSTSITDVALELGYSSHAHFTAAFSTAFGTTPTAYRALRRRTKAPVT